MTVRTRFAPSPTGFLHVGGARTALYAYLYAKKHNGEFILRIEDTDRERSTDEAIEAILDGMAWLGLPADQEPVYQTQRFARYNEVLQQLLTEDKAYRCTCSRERLDTLRGEQILRKEKPRYDGHCRDAAISDPDGSFVVRFRNPADGEVKFTDQVYGEITVQNSEMDDVILTRSDGTPTYNFTVVVDDSDMQITHVIRGEDHINNTPRQINILTALGKDIPVYAHLPMIHGDDGKKLSKRHGAVSVMAYRDEGYLPTALNNYLVRLGWSHGDQEIFSMQEMVELFDFEHIHKSAAVFNTEKLQWLNQHYLKNQPVEEVVEAFAFAMQQANIDITTGPDLAALIPLQAERCKTLTEMVERSTYFYQDVTTYDEKAVKKNFKEGTKEVLENLIEQFQALENWTAEPIHAVVIGLAEKMDLKLGKVAQPIRVAVTGTSMSPSIDITLELIGKDRVIKRLKSALSLC